MNIYERSKLARAGFEIRNNIAEQTGVFNIIVRKNENENGNETFDVTMKLSESNYYKYDPTINSKTLNNVSFNKVLSFLGI